MTVSALFYATIIKKRGEKMKQNWIKLDHLGQFYAATNNENNPGVFNVSAHLNEPILPDMLQKAVNDLMQRLPYLNVKSTRGFLWHYNQMLAKPPIILNERAFPALCRCFKNNHLMRFIYGEKSITVEVLHSVCDGRSLAMVLISLLARYFELPGNSINKEGLIDCNAPMHTEEAEDAYLRYADAEKSTSDKIKEVYKVKYEPVDVQIKTIKFDLAQIKSKAKAYGATITEYIMAHICNEFAKQRKADACNKPITVNVPIDCRGFFPTKSMRNFVSNKVIVMPEARDFTELIKGIKNQFATIDADFIKSNISDMERQLQRAWFVPLFIKNWVMARVGEATAIGSTTGFSNLGLIKLPVELQGRVAAISFALGAEPNMPYQFACVATGNTLTLTATTTAKDTAMIKHIENALKDSHITPSP